MTQALDRFRFQDAAELIYGFLWGELADWYLELAKPRLYGDAGEQSQAAARATLGRVLDGGLRLLHPIMPFVTEAVWQRLPRAAGDPASIMVSEWPRRREEWEDAGAESRMAELQELISAVRNIRAEYGVEPGKRVPLRVAGASPELRETLEASRRALHDLARVEEFSLDGGRGEIGATAVLRSGAEVFVPLGEVLDLDRETRRLREELARVEGLYTATEIKLKNESFVSRAPAEVVGRERDKLRSYGEQREKLAAKLAGLEGRA